MITAQCAEAMKRWNAFAAAWGTSMKRYEQALRVFARASQSAWEIVLRRREFWLRSCVQNLPWWRIGRWRAALELRGVRRELARLA